MSNKIEKNAPHLSPASVDNVPDYIDPETGEVHAVHIAQMAPRARTRKRLNQDGSERLVSIPLVSSLLRQPSLKDRINAMVRSGELAQKIREAQNSMNDDDDDFEGFDRNYLEENLPTPAEMDNIRRIAGQDLPQGSQEPPQAPSEPPATPVPDTPPDAA